MTTKDIETLYRTITPEGFNSFLSAVKRARSTNEVTALELQIFLGRIVEGDKAACRIIGNRGDAMSAKEKGTLTVSAKTVAMYMLLLADTRSFSHLSEMAILFLEYSSYLVKANYDLSGIALKAASYKIKDIGFTWSSIEHALTADMLAYHFCSHARFDCNERLSGLEISGRGHGAISDGILSISSSAKWESSVKSLETDGGNILISTRNSREEKLKLSDTNDIVKLDDFSKTFINSQIASERLTKIPKKLELKVGDVYAVCITDYEDTGEGYFNIKCNVLGTDEKSGIIEDEELIKGIYTADLLPYIFEGDCVLDAKLIENNDVPVFSIKESYTKFCKDSADKDVKANTILESKVIRLFKGTSEDKNRVIWMTANGYGGLLKDEGRYREGGKGYVKVRFAQTAGRDLFVNLDEGGIDESTSVSKFVEEDVLFNKFTYSIDHAYRILNRKFEQKPVQLGRYAFISLGRILARKHHDSSIERYKALVTSAWISNLADDPDNMSFSLARAEYLKNCIALAQRVNMTVNIDEFCFTDEEKKILRCISCINTCDQLDWLRTFLGMYEEDGIVGKIAQLAIASDLSNKHPEEVKFDSEQLRKRLCDILGVGDLYTSRVNKGGGKYGNGELDNVEFKASYVMRNDGKGPDMDYQGRGQVFEAVCGLLNKDGGTVYVGVNNFGDPYTIPGSGIDGDLDWFRSNFDTVKMLKSHQMGHAVPQPKDLDTYCLFLNDERDLYFKPSLKDYITISPTEDQDAVKISVRPSQFEIAVLYKDNTWREGQAFVRDGQETVPMSRIQQEQRLMKLRSVGKVEKFILTLSEAIDKQQKVILKNYASSSSNMVKDRFIVPVNLVCNNENVWGYDLESRKMKEFRLSRIETIETDLDNASYPHAFAPGQADVFRWINPDVNYHIKLKMTIAALNNLREEYSNTKNLPKEELYQISPERWILDTTLHGFGAVRRFYLGLADQIEIMDTEDSEMLKKEIATFVDKNIR